MAFRRITAGALGMAVAMAVGSASAEQTMSRGEYIYRLAGCENCHTDREHDGPRLAGGRKLATPLGVFYTPNITPDVQTGIGRWSEADFIRALRKGKSPDGHNYYPSFPYTSYTHLTDEDMRALWGYLRTMPAVRQANKSHELPWYLGFRPLLVVWKWLYFSPGAYQPEAAKSAEWNRGAYLVSGAGHCGECHTPRNLLGGFNKGYFLAGTARGPEGAVVPNITQDRQYGIGTWKVKEIAQYLENGMRPDGDFAGSLMAEVIDNGMKYLRPADVHSIAAYLTTQSPVQNAVRKAAKAIKGKSESEY